PGEVGRIAVPADDHLWMIGHLHDPPHVGNLLRAGAVDLEATVIVRNFLDVPSIYELKIVCPPGIRFDPSVATLRVEAGGSRSLPVRVSAAADAAAGLSLVAIDITQDGVRRGQLFDVIVNVTS
ncbi:MAG: hypothetical protein ACKOWG_17170, partial [Planctomycetia bacterium]